MLIIDIPTYKEPIHAILYTEYNPYLYNMKPCKAKPLENTSLGKEALLKNESYFYQANKTLGNHEILDIRKELNSTLSLINPVNVKDYGAKGNGLVDDTKAFQNAINYASSSGAKTVIVPKGNYKITSTVIIKSGVTLQGGPKIPFKANFGMDFALLSVDPPKDKISSPAFRLEMGSAIKGFAFYWPRQSKNSSTPLKYGWAITTSEKSSGADNIQIEDIMLTNCYNGINVDYGGQLNVRNIFGQTSNIGIRFDRLYDASRLENVHFWDFWANEGTKAKAYVQLNGEAVVIGRVDGLQATNIFAYGHKSVLHFVDFGSGSAWGQVNNITADVCFIPIIIDKVNIIQLSNVNGTVNDKKSGKSFVETGNRIDGEVGITNLNAYLPQTVINIKSTNGTFKLNNITGRKRGTDQFDVFQYTIINQSTAKVYIDEVEYNEFSGVIQIGPSVNFSPDKNITDSIRNFSQPNLWNNNSGRVTAIPNGSRFDLNGKIEVVRIPVPKRISDEAGIYIIECDLKLNNAENLNSDGQFYLRLTDFAINDIILPGSPINGYFTEKTHLSVPFIVRKSGLYFDFVYGNNSNKSPCTIDITNLKIFSMDNYKMTRSLIDWLHTKQPNALHLPLPKILK